MEPIDASASVPRYQHSPVRSKYLPECPPGIGPLSPSPPVSGPASSEKSSVLSGTNSRDKKGLNESRTAV